MNTRASKYFPGENVTRLERARGMVERCNDPVWLILTDSRVAAVRRLNWEPIFGILPYVFRVITRGRWAFDIPLREIAEVKDSKLKGFGLSKHKTFHSLHIRTTDGTLVGATKSSFGDQEEWVLMRAGYICDAVTQYTDGSVEEAGQSSWLIRPKASEP